jgi:hypothetical protein
MHYILYFIFDLSTSYITFVFFYTLYSNATVMIYDLLNPDFVKFNVSEALNTSPSNLIKLSSRDLNKILWQLPISVFRCIIL